MTPRAHAPLAVLAVLLLACSSEDPASSGAGGASSSSSTSAGTGGAGTAGAGTGGEAAVTWLGSEVRFASEAEASSLLGAADDFTSMQTAFDRGVRMQTIDPVTESDFLAFAAQQARVWTPDEEGAWQESAAALAEALDGLQLSLPPEILFVKSTGAEEFGKPYTRGAAIVMPESFLDIPADFRYLITAHELLHIATRFAPELRDELFPVFDFSAFGGVQYPVSLDDRRLTNPDAFSLDHWTTVVAGTEHDVVPMLHSTEPVEVAMTKANPQDFVQILLVEVDVATATVVEMLGQPVTFDAAMTDYSQSFNTGTVNTDYIVHPEEMVADNFAALLQRRAGMPFEATKPELLDALEEALAP
jgi:hypothetical protein